MPSDPSTTPPNAHANAAAQNAASPVQLQHDGRYEFANRIGKPTHAPSAGRASQPTAEADAWADMEHRTWRGRAVGRVHTRLTRNGVHMAFVAVFAVLGGAARGFNLLVILAGLMVGILLMQWRFCRATLPGLTVKRSLPRYAFAGTPFRVRFVLTNHRRWLPAWLIQIQDRIRGPALPARGAEGQCAVAITQPGKTEPSQYECVLNRRGRYRFGPVRLATGFPFGLINTWKNTRTAAPLVVFPRLAHLQPNWTGVIENRREGLASTRHNSGHSEGEFFGIRGWQAGDSKRWIHWRTTARVGDLAVRQFEQRNRTQLSVILDPFSEIPPRVAAREDDPALEWAISVAAAILVETTSVATSRVAFAMADGSGRAFDSQRMNDFSSASLQLLATVKGNATPNLHDALLAVLRAGNPNWPILIVSPRSAQFELLRTPPSKNSSGTDSSDTDSAGTASSGTNGRRSPLLSDHLLSRLDLLWLDTSSTASRRVAVPPVESSHGIT